MDEAPSPTTPSRNGDVFRILVVAAEEHVAEPVRRELAEYANGRRAEVRVVVPALADSPFQHAAGDVDEPMERAQDQLETSLSEARQAGVEAGGRVGDADPLRAIEDALYEFPADEIAIVTHPAAHARWLEGDLFERAKDRFGAPLTHFVVDDGIVEVAGHRARNGEALRREPVSEMPNLPRFSARDVAGIVFAVVGTLILIVIAATNPDETGSGFDFDALHTIIAGAFALVNIAHIVGLVLFESVGYSGPAQRFFANLSLYGTAAAICVSLLLLAM
jgi:hypothetical protein